MTQITIALLAGLIAAQHPAPEAGLTAAPAAATPGPTSSGAPPDAAAAGSAGTTAAAPARSPAASPPRWPVPPADRAPPRRRRRPSPSSASTAGRAAHADARLRRALREGPRREGDGGRRPEERWWGKAEKDADVVFSGAEYMLTELERRRPGFLDRRRVAACGCGPPPSSCGAATRAGSRASPTWRGPACACST